MPSQVSNEQERKKSGSQSIRSRVNYCADVLALAAGALVLVTGLVLLLRFHVAHGSLSGSGMGLSRLAWVNAHRFAAVLTFVAVAAHIQLHWRTIVVRLSRASKRLPGGASLADVVLYAGFVVVSLSAAIAWFAVPGSPPLLGPVTLGPAAHARHMWIDLHNRSALVMLPAAVIHVRKHIGWLLRASGLGGAR